jgi:spoIIIJ-associated protein
VEILVGRRGQTLDALQFVVRLITSKNIKFKVPIIVDVENYKHRRYEDLKALAVNVAAQVRTRKTSIRLEPMSAYERRIIHMTLADDPDVMTDSTGEGESRRVVIMPKRK